MSLKQEIQPEAILLFVLVLLGSIPFSLYARWIGMLSTTELFETLKHVIIIWITSFAYSFVSTGFLRRINSPLVVSPIMIWIYIWVQNIIGEFYVISGSLNTIPVDSSSLIMLYLFALVTVFYLAWPQQFLIQKIFGFEGGKEECCSKFYVSTTNVKKLSRIFKESLFFKILGLQVKQKLSEDTLEVKASDKKKRNAYLYFFIRKIDASKTSINIVAFKKNSSIFRNYINSPDWINNLVEKARSLVQERGGYLTETDDSDFSQEALQFAFKGVKPLFSKQNLEKLILPLTLIMVTCLMFGIAAYFFNITPTLSIELITLIITLIIFMIGYSRRK